jgi:hypothetical protein
MEGLKLRAYVLAGLFAVSAVAVYLTPKPTSVPGRDENWMEKVAPARVANYAYIASPEDPQCTYKSPKMVYDTLIPTVGILARVYEYQGQRFDVTLIASRDRASFHDPRVCFTAQGYNITEEQAISIPTQTRGNIPATLAKMTTPNSGDTVAVYFYRGADGFHGGTTNLKVAMLKDQVMGKPSEDAVFYRFIPTGDISVERLEKFIGLYMDTAGKESKGYF